MTDNALPTATNEEPLPTVATVKESFEVLKTLFQPRNLFAAHDRTVEYHITGKDGGTWTVRIRNRSCQIEKGEAADADFVVSANSDDWLDMVNGKLVTDFGRFTICRKGPPQYDEDSEYGITLDQEIELRALGLLGRKFVLPLWARRAGLTEASQLRGITSDYGDLDHEEFTKSMEQGVPLEQGPKVFTESLRAKDFRRITWPAAALILCWWLLMPLVLCLVPLAFLVGWKFGKDVGLPVGGVLLFVVPWAAYLAHRGVTRRLEHAALTDPAFFRYAFEHGMLAVPDHSDDKPSFDAWGPFVYLMLALPSALLTLCLWLVYVLVQVARGVE